MKLYLTYGIQEKKLYIAYSLEYDSGERKDYLHVQDTFNYPAIDTVNYVMGFLKEINNLTVDSNKDDVLELFQDINRGKFKIKVSLYRLLLHETYAKEPYSQMIYSSLNYAISERMSHNG